MRFSDWFGVASPDPEIALFPRQTAVKLVRSVQPIQVLKTLCVAAMLGWCFMPGAGAAPQIEPGTVQDIAIPYYAKGQSTPVAVVRIKRLFTDYQRRGFFRIGLLPTLVAEGVQVEVSDSRQVVAALQGAQRWLKPAAVGKALEWRQVEFEFSELKGTRLEATRVQIAEGGAWQLSGGVLLRSGTNELRRASAILQVTGANAGDLLLDNGPSTSLNLLQLYTDNITRR
jgi:hypothetical protein